MGLISKRLMLYGPNNKKAREVLFDSGATKSFIRQNVAQDLGPTIELPEPRVFRLASGTMEVREGIILEVGLGRHKLIHTFLIVEDLSEEAIVGADFLQEWHIKLDPRNRKIILDPKALRLRAGGAR